MSTFCSAEVNGLATNIWQNLGSPATVSPGYVAAWLITSGNLGKLNTALDTCFSISGGACIVPAPDSEVQAIYEMVYRQNLFAGQQGSLLTSISAGTSTNTWTRLTEGDSTIQRASPTELVKAFNATMVENAKQLRLAIGDYRRNHSFPATVDAASLASYPTP